MKKSSKIGLIVFAVVVLAVAWMTLSGSGRFFWNNAVFVPVMKNFAEPCGYGGTTGNFVGCECDGFAFEDIMVGSTTTYCTGRCGSCACSTYDFVTGKTAEADCAAKPFSDMGWSFLLDK